MKSKRALLPLIFFLFLVLPAANANWIEHIENSSSAAGDLSEGLMGGEISNPINDGTYSDGVIDNFDYFVNPGYPASNTKIADTGGG